MISDFTEEPEKPEQEVLQFTGDTAHDLEMALRAAAYLLEFVHTLGVEGLLDCAATIRAYRKEGQP